MRDEASGGPRRSSPVGYFVTALVATPPIAYGTSEVVAIDDIHTDDIHTDDIHTDDIHTDDIHTDDIHTDDIHTDDIHTDDIHIDDIHIDDIHIDDIHIDDIHIDDIHIDDIRSVSPAIHSAGTRPIRLGSRGTMHVTVSQRNRAALHTRAGRSSRARVS